MSGLSWVATDCDRGNSGGARTLRAGDGWMGERLELVHGGVEDWQRCVYQHGGHPGVPEQRAGDGQAENQSDEDQCRDALHEFCSLADQGQTCGKYDDQRPADEGVADKPPGGCLGLPVDGEAEAGHDENGGQEYDGGEQAGGVEVIEVF